jgi:putative pyrroloquinoline-quinone-binding quinoprotein
MQKPSFIGLVFFGTMFFAGSAAQVIRGATAQPMAVTTYHYDNLRTGWNQQETTLTPQNVNQTTFGILGTVPLDDQVDAQPLIVPNQTIAGGTHDVVYVVTENNTVYAIDASSGAILLSNHLGTPVPTPLRCLNNGPNVGINGTPTIDLATQTLYVIAYLNGSPPIYRLHALKLSDLTDKVPPATVAASHKLTNGSTYTFDATYQRQRPALLELNGNVYGAFGGFCDYHADKSRGWLLGWSASTLKPLPANHLDDTQATSPTSFFLDSIWMSGYGIAGTGSQLYFSTGNSDGGKASSTTYDGVTNIQESIVGLEGDLTHIFSIFTPSNVLQMDQHDRDLGSGGVLLLPTQSGSVPFLAVAAGKDGRLFLLDRSNLGGFTPGGPDKVLDEHLAPNCWCGPSFFTDSVGINRIVTSQGTSLQTWQVLLSPKPHLLLEGKANIATGQDSGFFTVVSSNGTSARTAIIWAVGRPKTTTTVNLYAFEATPSAHTYKLLFSSPAGSWPNTGGNANIVPVVANGKVYVASNRALTIFGILPGHAPKIALQPSPIAHVIIGTLHVITGTLLAVNGSTLTFQTRTGKSVKIDAAQAVKHQQVGALIIGVPFTAQGSSFNGNGALQADAVVRAKGSSGELWPPDR